MKIYIASSLFNKRECDFNCRLNEELEKLGYETFFAQRDGNEFTNLYKILKSKNLSPKQTSSVLLNIIYFFDMGVILPQCDIVVANFDENPDQGVDIEVTYAKLAGKHIIGFRTDARTPYGSGELNGLHQFPAFQCDDFILYRPKPCTTVKESDEQMEILAEEINKKIKNAKIKNISNLHFDKVQKIAQLIFNDIDDIHTDESINTIIDRCLQYEEEINKARPKITMI